MFIIIIITLNFHDDSVNFFVQLLPTEVQQTYLTKLYDLLKLDNNQNWRLRQELAMLVCIN